MATGLAQRLDGHVRALAGDVGERTIEHGLASAEDYIATTLASIGLAVERQPYDHGGVEVANLVARVGPSYGLPWVVAAHYDTVPGSPGADDNASAVAVLLELARALVHRPPATPVWLAAFTLEEAPAFGTPSQGSRVAIARWRERGWAVRGALVLEMVGYTAPTQSYPGPLRWAGYPASGDFIGVVANRRSRRLRRGVEAGLRRSGAIAVEGLTVPFDGHVLPETRLSDHSAFWDAGWPAVMVTDTAFFRNPNYHRPTDRPETLDPDFMARLVTGLTETVTVLADRGP